MARKDIKKDVESINVEKEVQEPIKKQPKTQSYPLRVRLSVGGVWREVGESIKLTESQHRDFHIKKIV